MSISPRILVLGSLAAGHVCLGNNRQLKGTDHSAHKAIRIQVNTYTKNQTTEPRFMSRSFMSRSGSCASYSS